MHHYSKTCRSILRSNVVSLKISLKFFTDHAIIAEPLADKMSDHVKKQIISKEKLVS